MSDYVGDRECPSCGKISLIENSINTWKCTNKDCSEVFDEEYLDCSEE